MTLNQSLRILANLIGAGAVNSRGILDEMINGLLGFTTALIRLKIPDGNDLMAKVSRCFLHTENACYYLRECSLYCSRVLIF